ncbi:MAG: hypothetical protein GY772_19295 [bacterium]|nr:hypothetical protein [bacterium]
MSSPVNPAIAKSGLVQRLMKDMAAAGVSRIGTQEEVVLWGYTQGLLDGIEKCKREICAISGREMLEELAQQIQEGATVRGGTMAWLEEASGVDPGPSRPTPSSADVQRAAAAAAEGAAASGVDPGPGAARSTWRKSLASPPLAGLALSGKAPPPVGAAAAGSGKQRREAAAAGPRGAFEFQVYVGKKAGWVSYEKAVQLKLGKAWDAAEGEIRIGIDIDGWDYSVILRPSEYPPDAEGPKDEENIIGLQLNKQSGKMRLIRMFG